jgi:hypothetical protein
MPFCSTNHQAHYTYTFSWNGNFGDTGRFDEFPWVDRKQYKIVLVAQVNRHTTLASLCPSQFATPTHDIFPLIVGLLHTPIPLSATTHLTLAGSHYAQDKDVSVILTLEPFDDDFFSYEAILLILPTVHKPFPPLSSHSCGPTPHLTMRWPLWYAISRTQSAMLLSQMGRMWRMQHHPLCLCDH